MAGKSVYLEFAQAMGLPEAIRIHVSENKRFCRIEFAIGCPVTAEFKGAARA